VADPDLELIGGAEKREIVLHEHDPAWAATYEAHAAQIRAALGPAVLRLEHIGSTSVPDLAAKPIVDVMLVVEDPSDEASYVPALEAAGYVLRVREPSFDQHRMLRTPEVDVHVHVFPPWSGEIERHLLLRDLLRRDARAREGYEGVKRQLAAREWETVNHYAEAKTHVIERLIAQARGERHRHP
jgi:GrpB-like predicted nucleotidyltransferase (UPF0157 family)